MAGGGGVFWTPTLTTAQSAACPRRRESPRAQWNLLPGRRAGGCIPERVSRAGSFQGRDTGAPRAPEKRRSVRLPAAAPSGRTTPTPESAPARQAVVDTRAARRSLGGGAAPEPAAAAPPPGSGKKQQRLLRLLRSPLARGRGRRRCPAGLSGTPPHSPRSASRFSCGHLPSPLPHPPLIRAKRGQCGCGRDPPTAGLPQALSAHCLRWQSSAEAASLGQVPNSQLLRGRLSSHVPRRSGPPRENCAATRELEAEGRG